MEYFSVPRQLGQWTFKLCFIIMVSGNVLGTDYFYFTDTLRRGLFRMEFSGTIHEKVDVTGLPVSTGFLNPIAVACDEVTGDVYVTERGSDMVSTRKYIKRHSVNQGPDTVGRSLPRAAAPDGLAVDPLSGLVYLADTGDNYISALSRDLKYSTLIISEDLDEPRGIALDPFEGWLFWSDWSASSAHIGRARMDGSKRMNIITTGLGWPNAITYDVTDQQVYWADARLSTIQRCDADGSNRVTLLTASPRRHFFGLVVDETHLYWTEWTKNVLQRIGKQGGVVSMIQNVGAEYPVNSTRMNGLALYKSSRFLIGINLCVTGNGGCQHLCIPTGRTTKVCKCGQGYIMNSDGKTCTQLLFRRAILFTDFGRKGLFITDLDERATVRIRVFGHLNPRGITYDSENGHVYWVDASLRFLARHCTLTPCVEVVYSFPETASRPEGLAIDMLGQSLYVVDAGLKSIDRITYNGVHTQVINNLDKPRGVAFDAQERTLYWTDWGISPKIGKKQLDTGSPEDFVTTGIVWPNGIAIDEAARKLYWTDGLLNRIESINLDGTGREVVQKDLTKMYMGVTVGGGQLYWTVAGSTNYYSMSLATKAITEHGDNLLLNAFDVAYFNTNGGTTPPTPPTSTFPFPSTRLTTRPTTKSPIPKVRDTTTTPNVIPVVKVTDEIGVTSDSGGVTSDSAGVTDDPNMSGGERRTTSDSDSIGGPSQRQSDSDGGGGVNSTLIIAISVVVGGSLIAIVVIVTGIVCYKRMQKKEEAHRRQNAISMTEQTLGKTNSGFESGVWTSGGGGGNRPTQPDRIHDSVPDVTLAHGALASPFLMSALQNSADNQAIRPQRPDSEASYMEMGAETPSGDQDYIHLLEGSREPPPVQGPYQGLDGNRLYKDNAEARARARPQVKVRPQALPPLVPKQNRY